jgi:type I restriction enzyme S subunit
MINLITANKYCESVFDGTHDSPKANESGFPLITSKNILNGVLNLNDTYLISEKDYLTIQNRSSVKKWDIIFSMIGSVGEVYLEKNNEIPYAIKNVGVFSTNDEFKAKWLYYYLKSPYAKIFIKNSLAGAVQKFLSLGKLRDFPIFQYDRSKDDTINFLSALDDKIELNNQINTVLEAIAKTLYDYWFVQFDFPDENGKPYQSSGGKMVFNDILKREIPVGWEVKKLEELVREINTGLNPRTHFKLGEGDNFYITIRNVEYGILNFTDSCDRISDVSLQRIQKRSRLEKGDILFTSIEPVGKTYLLREKPINWNINESVFSIKPNYELVTSEFLFMLLSSFEMKLKCKNSSTGSIHKGIRINPLKEFCFSYAGVEIQKSFSDTIKPILDRIDLNQKQNQELAQLRDWLLPMLMNGQVRVGSGEYDKEEGDLGMVAEGKN